MHIRIILFCLCSLLGSWHDLLAYRVDDEFSDQEADYDFEHDGWEDWGSPYTRVACGYGVYFATWEPLRRCLLCLIQSCWTCTRHVPKWCTQMLNYYNIMWTFKYLFLLYGTLLYFLRQGFARDSLLGLSQRCRDRVPVFGNPVRFNYFST